MILGKVIIIIFGASRQMSLNFAVGKMTGTFGAKVPTAALRANLSEA